MVVTFVCVFVCWGGAGPVCSGLEAHRRRRGVEDLMNDVLGRTGLLSPASAWPRGWYPPTPGGCLEARRRRWRGGQ
jgi:hypothetical protein